MPRHHLFRLQRKRVRLFRRPAMRTVPGSGRHRRLLGGGLARSPGEFQDLEAGPGRPSGNPVLVRAPRLAHFRAPFVVICGAQILSLALAGFSQKPQEGIPGQPTRGRYRFLPAASQERPFWRHRRASSIFRCDAIFLLHLRTHAAKDFTESLTQTNRKWAHRLST